MIRRPIYLRPLPDDFAATVAAVHTLAEHVLCVPRYASVGRVGLVAALDGVETPPFGPDDRVVGVDSDELVDRDRYGERRAPITDLRDAASFFGCSAGAPAGLWSPVTPLDLDAPLAVDRVAVGALADWFGFATEALAGLGRIGADLDVLTLWPEGFDLATTTGRMNVGGSPGDRFIDRPYLYVGPFERDFPPADPPYWNESFGAALPYEAIGSVDEAVAFLARGHRLVTG